MCSPKVMLLSVFLSCIVFSEAMSDRDRIGIEPRGKKKKIALFVYFADIILKKIFIFKLIYAFIFWLVIHKAGYFLTWFISYLKEQKRNHDHYVPHYDHGPSYGPHYDHGPSYEPHYDHGPSYGPHYDHGPSYEPHYDHGPSYEPHYDHGPGYGPYRRESHGI